MYICNHFNFNATLQASSAYVSSYVPMNGFKILLNYGDSRVIPGNLYEGVAEGEGIEQNTLVL